MIWIAIILLIIFKLFLAGKDASSYLLKGKLDLYEGITKKRLDRWHRDGVALDALFTLAIAWATGDWILILIHSLLIRLGIYDLAFNKWASLPLKTLGTTSKVDRFFSKIFGANGAIIKSVIFLIIAIALQIVKTII